MRCLLSPAHFVGVAAYQFALLLLWLSPEWVWVPLALFVLISFVASHFPACPYFLPIVSRGDATRGAVSLTFDDGPDPHVTPLVLERLAHYGWAATFFVTGEKATRHPELIEAILKAGHTLGNHSYHHSVWMMFKPAAHLRREIERLQAFLKDFGVRPLAFRPPVGVSGPHLWPVLMDLGMFCLNFSCRARDMGNRSITRLAPRILKKVRAGDIVLLHDVAPPYHSTAALLSQFEQIFSGLKTRGLKVVPIAELIGREIMEKTHEGGVHAAALFYDGLAEAYDAEQFASAVSVSRTKEQALFNAQCPTLFSREGLIALDIGAGTGIFTLPIAEYAKEVDALDISAKMLARLEEKCEKQGLYNIRTIAGNVETMPLPRQYDLVFAFSSFAYLEDLPAFFKKLSPHVNPGGKLYFITARTSIIRFFTQIGNAMRQGLWLKAYRRRALERMLMNAGFKPVLIEAHLLKSWFSGGIIFEVLAEKSAPTLTVEEGSESCT